MIKTITAYLFLLSLLLLFIPLPAHSLAPGQLRCEYRSNPLGLDVAQPRLSWMLPVTQRGARQTAYQVLVASSPQMLTKDKGDLWDSGRAPGDQFTAVYAGKSLTSRLPCYWKARVWDGADKPGAWSQTASWSMGLLHATDWKAQWISDSVLAAPANRPRTPIHCYRSALSTNPDAPKWITLDLGAPRRIDAINLMPARPQGLNGDISTVQFPRRFRLEAADNAEFRDAALLVDQTGADFPQPRRNDCRFEFTPVTARCVRLFVTRLGVWDAHDYGIFLAQVQVFAGQENVAVGASVTASDSLETEQWSKRFLVDGKAQVSYAPFPAALAPNVPGVFSPSRVPLLRRDFMLPAAVKRATLYSTARGFYEARINGQRVSNDLLAPGFTDYDKRVSYQSYDVTALLHQGPNTVAALLGYGWYAGHMNLSDNCYIYGYFPQLLAQLEIDLTDGRHLTIGTDSAWRTTLEGPVRWSDLLDDEAYDCRQELPGWDQPGFADAGWQAAWTQPRGSQELVWQRTPPVRVIQTIRPIKRQQVRPGVWVYDLGQEITGWCRAQVAGVAGTHITLRHAEAVKPDGTLDTGSLWGTPQRDDYFLDGKGPRVLEPHFTYHGFRYVELSGLPDAPRDDTLVAVNIHTDVAQTGHFACSNELFNRLMNASRWTQKNMLFDVPAGCAARSERLAWTGDIRPCVQTALFNFDTAAFFEKYAADLRDDQKADGRFTDICPHAHLRGTEICVGSPGWADAGVSLPWDLYVNTGDRRVLAEHYEAARRWVDFIYLHNRDLLWLNARGQDWGDWLSAGQATPRDIGSTAFFAHSTDLVARMAQALGRKDDATRYRALFNGIRQAFARRFVTSTGIIQENANGSKDVTDALRHLMQGQILKLTVNNETLGGDPAPNTKKRLLVTWKAGAQQKTQEFAEDAAVDLNGAGLEIVSATYGATAAQRNDTQGSYALSLQFGLLDEPLRSQSAARLVEVIQRDGGHPSTGFWSSVELLLALSSHGQHATASQMVNLRTAPSWGYMVESGGTTFWEAFDADKKNLSLNHWTHSAVGEWLWRDVAGLNPDPAQSGYAGFTVRPRPTPEVSWCQATYDSVRGPIAIDWRNDNAQFSLKLTVPANSVATVFIPATAAALVSESGQPANRAAGVKFLRMDGTAAVYAVQAGSYNFTVRQ